MILPGQAHEGPGSGHAPSAAAALRALMIVLAGAAEQQARQAATQEPAHGARHAAQQGAGHGAAAHAAQGRAASPMQQAGTSPRSVGSHRAALAC